MLRPAILIVDDDADIRMALGEELSGGYQIVMAKSAEDGLQKFSEKNFEAVISDFRMPGMSGVAFIDSIKDINPETVTILLTGFADEEVRSAAHRKDGAYMLKKPWGDELEIVLKRAIEQKNIRGRWLHRANEEKGVRENLERVAFSMEKMASLGVLVSGIAHEMRTPLTYLICNVAYLKEEIERLGEGVEQMSALFKTMQSPEHEKLRRCWEELAPAAFVAESKEVLGECREGVDRLDQTLMALRRFGGSSETETEAVDVYKAIEDARKLVLCTYPHGVEIQVEDKRDPVVVEGHTGEIVQVFVNLMTNAAQAMKGQGEIKITARLGHGLCFIKVLDSGTGIPQEHLGRVFDAFYTTKQTEEGTGLGLHICREICRSYDGELEYTGGPNGGAEFTITLPLQKSDRLSLETGS